MERSEIIQTLFEDIGGIARMSAKLGVHSHGEHKDKPTRAQVGILFIVWHNGPISIKDIAEHLGATSSAATQLVNALVNNGLLTRTEDATDRRKICIALTTKGKKKLKEMKEKRRTIMTAMLKPLSNEELKTLQKIQKKIFDHVKTLWSEKNK